MLFVCALLAALAASAPAAIIRVKTTGNDTNDGSTWPLAKRTVQAAINTAVTGDEIWVAKGLYVEPSGSLTTTCDVALYGGFNGTETAREQRDWNKYITILDGNNAVRVLTIWPQATSATIIDGFAIRNGASTGQGAGIYSDGGAPVIRNNVVTACRVDWAYVSASGAGLYLRGGAAVAQGNCIKENPQGNGVYANRKACIQGNVISGNGGSGIRCEGDEVVIEENLIVGNGATNGYAAGGLEMVNSSSVVRHNVFVGNHGAAIRALSGAPVIVGNTVVSNSGAGFDNDEAARARVVNNILAFNEGCGISNDYGLPWLAGNCVYSNAGGNYSGAIAGYQDITADPRFVGLEAGDYRLRPVSPCIDAGYEFSDPDPDGTRADIGARPYFHLAAVKVLPDGTQVSLSSIAVTSGTSDEAGMFVQDTAGRAGLRVQGASDLASGSTLDLTGVMQTDSATGERYLSAIVALPAFAEQMPGVAFIACRWLGGGVFGSGAVTQPGVEGGVGLNTIGLLVRLAGRVKASLPGALTLDDGSGVPVQVSVPAGVAVPSGAFVRVTGISSSFTDGGGHLRPSLLCRTALDVVTVAE